MRLKSKDILIMLRRPIYGGLIAGFYNDVSERNVS